MSTTTANKRPMTSWHLLGALALACPLVLTLAGCNGCNTSSQQAPIIVNGTPSSGANQDPASANMASDSYNAPTSGGAAPIVSNRSGATGQTAAPIVRVAGQQQSYTPEQSSESYDQQPAYDSGYDQQPTADDSIYATQPPPELPEYDQPPAPGDNYLWTPGYWNYANAGYYWVPGIWVAAPYYGALWTPPYWGWYGGRYWFHHGYWGPHVGFYGGVNYGFGYIGTGYWGGYWHGRDFWYNRSITRVGNVRNVYERSVIYNNVRYGMQPNNRVSYNGGRGGINRAPNAGERNAMHESHEGPTATQHQVRNAAMENRAQFASVNRGRPANTVENRGIGSTNNIRSTPSNVTLGRSSVNGNSNHSNGTANAVGGFQSAGHGATPNFGSNNMNRNEQHTQSATPQNTNQQGQQETTQRQGFANQNVQRQNEQHTFQNNTPSQNNARNAEQQQQRAQQQQQQRVQQQERAQQQQQQRAQEQQQRSQQQRMQQQQQRVQQQQQRNEVHTESARPQQQHAAPAPRPSGGNEHGGHPGEHH